MDLSPTLIALARERLPHDVATAPSGSWSATCWIPTLGRFDHIVAMDSLIHYRPARHGARAVATCRSARRHSLLLTFAPRTTLLAAMHAVGRLFPRGDRAPAIEPVREGTLSQPIGSDSALAGWRAQRTHRVARGFYISQALEVTRR